MKQLLLLPFLLLLTNGCTEKPTQTFIRSVMLTTPIPSGAESIKNFSGVVQESHNIGLGFKTAGQIEKIYVKEGDYVKKGQLIAQLDHTDYQLGVQALEIQYKQLEDEVKRTEALYRSKSISINDYEKAQAGLQQLKVQLQVNRNKLAYTRLHAPTNGYIQSVNFAPSKWWMQELLSSTCSTCIPWKWKPNCRLRYISFAPASSVSPANFLLRKEKIFP